MLGWRSKTKARFGTRIILVSRVHSLLVGPFSWDLLTRKILNINVLYSPQEHDCGNRYRCNCWSDGWSSSELIITSSKPLQTTLFLSKPFWLQTNSLFSQIYLALSKMSSIVELWYSLCIWQSYPFWELLQSSHTNAAFLSLSLKDPLTASLTVKRIPRFNVRQFLALCHVCCCW